MNGICQCELFVMSSCSIKIKIRVIKFNNTHVLIGTYYSTIDLHWTGCLTAWWYEGYMLEVFLFEYWVWPAEGNIWPLHLVHFYNSGWYCHFKIGTPRRRLIRRPVLFEYQLWGATTIRFRPYRYIHDFNGILSTHTRWNGLHMYKMLKISGMLLQTFFQKFRRKEESKSLVPTSDSS